MALDQYILQVRRLLHDANANYWSNSELTDDINQARQRVALDSGSIRSLVNFYLSAGQESYPFMGAIASLGVAAAGGGYTSTPAITFTGGGGTGATAVATLSSGTVSGVTITGNGTGYTSAPTVSLSTAGETATATITASIMSALDILSVSVNWGNSWITLGYTYFTNFQAKARFYRNTTGQPAVWSKGPPASTGGGDSFYIFQIPSDSYQCDIDAVLLPNELADNNTAEQLQYPYTDLVQYYAAGLAKQKQQQMDEAVAFMKMYDTLLRQYTAAKYQRRVPNPFGG